MSKKKEFDCVKLKHEWFQKSWKKSGAKTIDEYLDYVNATAKYSSLSKSYEERMKNRAELLQES